MDVRMWVERAGVDKKDGPRNTKSKTRRSLSLLRFVPLPWMQQKSHGGSKTTSAQRLLPFDRKESIVAGIYCALYTHNDLLHGFWCEHAATKPHSHTYSTCTASLSLSLVSHTQTQALHVKQITMKWIGEARMRTDYKLHAKGQLSVTTECSK